ncbi:MAG: transposase, partial [Tannerella sp.]|nr:transposase [Tannerella sp.]
MMTPTDNTTKSVNIYCYVCEQYEKELQYLCQRFSNSSKPEFTDREAITVYLYAMNMEHRFKVRHIYEFAGEHLRSRFPKWPSYLAFINRINRLNEAFKGMTKPVLTHCQPPDCDTGIMLTDSMPLITCSGKRKAKVAKEITGKGFCSAKGTYYYGL